MSNGGRLFLAGLAGLAALATVFGEGLLIGSNQPDQERYQPYRYAADKQLEVDPALSRLAKADTLKDRAPCEQPKGHDESDLCAQWKAANAAEDSAVWTKWGFWIAIAGTLGLYWQINLTRKAVEDTGEATDAMREANEIARDTSRRQLRAYIGTVSADITLVAGSIPPEARLNISSRNVGQTPAHAMHTRVEYIFTYRGWRGEWNICQPESGHTVTVLFPTCLTELKDATVELGEYDRWVAGEIDLFIFSEIDYRDVFDEIHSTRSRWVVKWDQPLVLRVEDIGNSAT